MNALLFLILTACGGDPLPEGSLLFLENSHRLVERVTAGETGHVALIFHEENQPLVYEATPGEVRRIPLNEYLTEIARLNQDRQRREPIRIIAFRPVTPYRTEEIAAMRTFLEEQLGRRYSVKNYVTGKNGDGTHCAELAGNALLHSGVWKLSNPSRLSPEELRTAVQARYRKEELPIAVELPAETWCERSTRKWHSWQTWCLWSCGECWSFCW